MIRPCWLSESWQRFMIGSLPMRPPASRWCIARLGPLEKTSLVTRSLIPLDLTRFRAPRVLRPSLVNLPPKLLIANLAEEYIFAELCEAAALSLAAENVARMHAMTVARNNVQRMLDQLTGRYHRLRQEQINEELLEICRL